MQKRRKGRKLSREKDQRKALLKSLARALILEEKIKTTEARAKELASFLEKQITRAKTDSVHSRRVLAKHFSEKTLKKLFALAPRFQERKGGYTRIIKLGQRASDGARMAIIELVK